MTVARGARGGRRRAARAGRDRAHASPTRTPCPFSHRSGERDRAADLAAVVHAHGGARRARRSTAVARRPRARSTPSSQRRRYLDWLENIRPVVHLAPALVGPPDPGLVPRRGDLRRHGAAGGRRLGARPRRARHVVLVRACGRSRRSAGPTTRPSCAPSTRPTCSRRRRDILFLWVARMVMIGHRVHRRGAVRRRLHPLDDPGPRRPADVQVARHRDRPARRDRRARRRRHALRPARDVLDAGRALLRGEGRAGPPARQQALQRRRGSCCCAPTRA